MTSKIRGKLRIGGIAITTGALLAGSALAADDAAEGTEIPITAGYDKGFFIRSVDDLFALKIGLRLQGRYTYESIDDGEDTESESAFALQRARLSMKGHALVPELDYKLQIDFGKGDVTLKDFYANYEITDGIQIRGGQFKQPFARQQLNSSSKLEFVDRAIATDDLSDARDIGIMVHNGITKAKGTEWALALFNGTGEKGQLEGKVEVDPETGLGEIVSGKFSNVPDRLGPLVVGRLGFNDGKIKGYSEGDFEGGPLRWGVGGGLALAFDREDEADTAVLATVDGVVKVEGISTTAAAFLFAEEEPGSGKDIFDQDLTALGTYIQAGYMIDKTYEPALRYSGLFPEGGGNDTHQVTAAFSIYFKGHKLKWQNDVTGTFSEDDGEDLTDWRARSQVELSF